MRKTLMQEFDQYAEIHGIKKLCKAEEYTLFIEYGETKDPLLLKKVVMCNMWWILYTLSFLNSDEQQYLLTDAYIVALAAARNFDISNGLRFSSYMMTCIRRKVPRDYEVQQCPLGIPADEYWNRKKGENPYSFASLDTPCLADEAIDEVGAIYAEPTEIEQAIDCKALVSKLRHIIEKKITLTIREKQVLMLKFGFGEYQMHTTSETALKLDISISRVGQLESKALRRLRHPSISKGLREYL